MEINVGQVSRWEYCISECNIPITVLQQKMFCINIQIIKSWNGMELVSGNCDEDHEYVVCMDTQSCAMVNDGRI